MRRKIPIRTCIGCRKKGAKPSLIRFIFALGKGIQFDRRQIKPGRGAYVCPDTACLQKAWKRKAFIRALRLSPIQQRSLDEDFPLLEKEMEAFIARMKADPEKEI